MTVTRPCYASREDVKQALDVKQTARSDRQIDRAISSASDDVDGLMHRVFYPTVGTVYFDWPNFQSAYPWRIWFDASELADTTVNVPVVTSGGNVIDNADIFWGHPQYAPPYTYLELNRASSASFGQGSTPQRDVALTGTFGYWTRTRTGGALAAAVTDTTGTAVTGTDSSSVGVGDVILVDTERMTVTGKNMVTTAQTQLSGLTTALASDVSLGVTDGTKYTVNETLLLDSERLLIVDIAGNTLTVKRAWDGSVLSAHSGATVYAPRQFTVVRGDLGTTAATHTLAAVVSVNLVPARIRDLALATAIVQLTQEPGAYASSQGSGDNKVTGIGTGLDDLRASAYRDYGRQARRRVV
jgi:hypothetical protein